jgi:TonB-dependent receptor-like protein/carboxypeptidase family protein
MNLGNSQRRLVLRRTALTVALIAGLAGGADVLAQSNASGVIFGRTDTAAGTTIHLENVDTGFSRDLTPGSDGRYRASSLPIGRYRVALQHDGKTVDSRDNVEVQVNTGTDVSFASGVNAQNLEGVAVVANALPAIDVSSVDSRTVLTAEQLQKVPVARNITAAALLAPGTVAGDSRYGNVASFGGASAAENQYYINGYAVTNSLTGIGLSQLPFDAIDQQQVYIGGYGAEYGRSTGGVVNIITKRGTNQWKAGVQALWTPAWGRQNPRSVYLPSDGSLYQYRGKNNSDTQQYSAYVSGPLIKDRLFFYATGDFTRQIGKTTNSIAAGTHQNYDSKATRWLGKVDWNITDSHILEFTGFGDKTQEHDQVYAYDYDTLKKGNFLGSYDLKNYDGGAGATPGGNFYIGKYTGYITDNLTINALYGESESEHVQNPTSASGATCPYVTGSFTNAAGDVLRPPACYLLGSLLSPGANDKTKGWRLDVEYHLGDHDVRVGVDNQTLKSFSGTSYENNQRYTYAAAPASGLIPSRPDVAFPAGTLSYVDYRVFSAAAKVKVEQEAQFIEDRWQISDRWLAIIGLRNEQFKNFNGDGAVYVKQRHQLAPRLGVSWDVFGDSTLKVYANAGRYHLAVPANVAIRGASAQLYSSQYGTFTGVNADGSPQGFVPNGGTYFLNGANNVSPDPRTVAAKGLGAYYQDEYILGFDKQLGNDYTFGAKVIYRKLRNIIDDMCDARPFEKYAARNNIDITNATISGCYLFNPGKNNTFLVDTGGGNFQEFKLTKEDFVTPEGIGFPALKRKYYALDMYLEHQFTDRWYGKMEYVFSRSYGNSEGLLKSDIGQRDPSVTQDWDAPELMVGANGPLPNDRTHQLKSYGWFQMNDQWLFGANLAILSGRPKNCIGASVNDPIQYGEAYFYCDGKIAPRGSKGRLPYTFQLDLSAQWTPAWANHQLAFTADVFNIAGKQRVTSQSEYGNTDVGVADPDYERPLSYQTPRYLRLGARWDFSL